MRILFSFCPVLNFPSGVSWIVRPLNNVWFWLGLVLVLHLNVAAASSSLSKKSLVPNMIDSSTCIRTRPASCPYVFRSSTHKSVIDRCMCKDWSLWVRYVRYQCNPYSGIPYRGLMTFNICPVLSPSSSNACMYTL